MTTEEMQKQIESMIPTPQEIENIIDKHSIDKNMYVAFRTQAAIAAMQGVMNFFGSIDYNRETIAKLAVEQADALIEELSKQKI